MLYTLAIFYSENALKQAHRLSQFGTIHLRRVLFKFVGFSTAFGFFENQNETFHIPLAMIIDLNYSEFYATI